MSRRLHQIKAEQRLLRSHQQNARRRDAYKPVKTFQAIGKDGNVPPVRTVFIPAAPAAQA